MTRLPLALAATLALTASPAQAGHHRHHHAARAAVQAPPPTPFLAAKPFSMASDRNRTSSLTSAWIAHQSTAKPAGWTTTAAAIAATPDPLKKLALADHFINSHMHYGNRAGGPWTYTPAAAFTRPALCRDYAAAKAFLLLDAGFPASDLRVVTLAPNAHHAPHHVVVAARIAGKTYILDMLKSNRRGGYAIPATDAADPTESPLRTPVASVSATAWTRRPLQTAALPAETP